MDQTLIQKHSTAIMRGLYEKVKVLSALNHKSTKGWIQLSSATLQKEMMVSWHILYLRQQIIPLEEW